MKIARPARPVRAACFAALSLVCLVGLGFGLAIRSWPEPGRRIVEFAGYLLFVMLYLETLDSFRRSGVSRPGAGRS